MSRFPTDSLSNVLEEVKTLRKGNKDLKTATTLYLLAAENDAKTIKELRDEIERLGYMSKAIMNLAKGVASTEEDSHSS